MYYRPLMSPAPVTCSPASMGSSRGPHDSAKPDQRAVQYISPPIEREPMTAEDHAELMAAVKRAQKSQRRR